MTKQAGLAVHPPNYGPPSLYRIKAIHKGEWLYHSLLFGEDHGTSNVLFSLVRQNPTNPIPTDHQFQSIVIFSGQPQTTAISQWEWLRQD
jgi:hypothetical protein